MTDLPDDVDKYVFYRQQDARELWETGETHLSWQGDARVICDILRANGLQVEHDGDERHRILMRLPKNAHRPRPTFTAAEVKIHESRQM